MKRYFYLLACVCIAGIGSAQPKLDPTKPEKADLRRIDPTKLASLTPPTYLIMVPPWRAKKGAPNQITKSDARTQMDQWALTQKTDFPTGIPYLPRVVDMPMAGMLVFTTTMTSKQAETMQGNFKYDAGKPTRVGFFISELRTYEPIPIVDRGNDSSAASGGRSNVRTAIRDGDTAQGPECYPIASGAVDSYWTAGTVSLSSSRTPVLYVVDTGVQPLVQTLAAGYHPQYNIASSGRVRMLQGRVPTGGSIGTWPPNSATPSLWATTGPDQPLSIGAGDYPTAVSPSTALNPQLDPNGHGTKITSMAVGPVVGVLGKTAGPKVDVESIRIYNSTNTYTVDAIDGIGQAIEQHNIRYAAAPSDAASVLLFASRTTSGFDQILEVTLWWAWNQGMICVVGAGNTPTAYTGSGSSAKYSPDSQWYSGYGTMPTPQPTSPSRFDWFSAQNPATNANFWPAWADAPAGNPMPTSAYLIVVGGYAGTNSSVLWSGSSKGPEIDLMAPAQDVPCAKQVKSTQFATDDCLVLASGTSLSAGFVAGVACVYAANKNNNPTPQNFRDWLFPTTVGTASPIDSTTQNFSNPASPASQIRRVPYGNTIPRLSIKSTTNWQLP